MLTQFPTPSKHIDFFMLTGSLDFLRKEVKDWWKKLPAKYSSADEVAMAVFSIENADWSDDKETTEAMDVVHECFLQLPPDAEGKWGIYRKHSKKCTFYTLRFGCSFAAVNTIKPQLL